MRGNREGGGLSTVRAIGIHRDKGAVYIVRPDGFNPFWGFICCPPKCPQIAYERGALPIELRNIGIHAEDYDMLCDEINMAYRLNNVPSCPCLLFNIAGFLYIDYHVTQRNKLVNDAITKANVILTERKLKARYEYVPTSDAFIVAVYDLSNRGHANANHSGSNASGNNGGVIPAVSMQVQMIPSIQQPMMWMTPAQQEEWAKMSPEQQQQIVEQQKLVVQQQQMGKGNVINLSNPATVVPIG